MAPARASEPGLLGLTCGLVKVSGTVGMMPGRSPEMPRGAVETARLDERTPVGWNAEPLMAPPLLLAMATYSSLRKRAKLRIAYSRLRSACVSDSRATALPPLRNSGWMASKRSVVTLVVFFGLMKSKTVWLARLNSSSAPVGRILLMAKLLLSTQLLVWPSGVLRPV